jgi:hypothetical protein
MKQKWKLLLSLLAVLALVGCATPKPNMKLSEVIDAPVEPMPGKALVYFIRPSQAAWGTHAAVYDGDDFVGFVPYNQKLAYQADPGEHLFYVVSEAADFMTADLAEGRTYYAQVVPRMGAWRARYSLWAISAADLKTPEVRGWIDAARPVKNKPEAYTWAESNAASVQEKRAAYYAKWITKTEDKRPHLKAGDGE